jgi:dUTP pyrophosphatase
MKISVTRLDATLPIPKYAMPGDAGMDLYSSSDLIINPGERALVPTGLAIAIPNGYVGLIHPRSGLAAKHGISVVNAPGTIDSGYRGEIKVILINHDLKTPFEVKKGERIAQIVFQKYEEVILEEVEYLPDTARGDAGFGSTGGA